MPKTNLNDLNLPQIAYGRQSEQVNDDSTASSTEVINKDKKKEINTASEAYQNSLNHAFKVGN
jgi:hypothetical protein